MKSFFKYRQKSSSKLLRIAFLILFALALAYVPAIRQFLQKEGYFDEGHIGNIVIQFEDGWAPFLSNNTFLGKVLLGSDRPKLLFLKSNGWWPGWGNSIVAMKFNDEEIAILNNPNPIGNPFSEEVRFRWGVLKIYWDRYGGYVPDFGIQFSTIKGREQDFNMAMHEITKIVEAKGSESK